MQWRKVGAGIAVAGTLGTGGTIAVDRQIDPYSDKGTHYELPVKSDIPQRERVEIAKDKAEMTLRFWNDEGAIKITPQIPAAPTFGADKKVDRSFKTQADRKLLSKKMEYRSRDVTAFIEPREAESEFDIDFTLHAKPETNVFEYRIEGAEEFDFWYQPELTPEEIEEGAERPDNVVGSYAVYHKTKANHRVGHTNYATGKAFHIYRPKAIDANGHEIWAELRYSDSILSVTVPQGFLEKATYPVVVDPTFGYAYFGASMSTYCANSSDTSANTGMPVTFSQNATISAFHIGINLFTSTSESSVDFWSAIYREDSAGSGSHDHVASSENLAVNIPSAQPRWIDLTAAGEALIPDTYIIAGLCDGEDVTTVNGVVGSLFDNAGPLFPRYVEPSMGAGAYSALKSENPWTVAANSAENRIYSIYLDIAITGCDPSVSTCVDVYNRINTNGSGFASWTAPPNVTQADVACWGAGGGAPRLSSNGGGGGGGGAFASSTVSVTPGASYTIFIGAGGSTGAVATDGATTTFATTTVAAAGGKAGTTLGGAGGSASLSTGMTKFNGGAGAAGNDTSDAGGGGGGAAGPHGAGGAGAAASTSVGGGGGGGNGGGNASGTTGGSSTNGGAGGTGDSNGSTDPTGYSGVSHINGGGGGGGGDNSDPGGNGGQPGGGGGGSETTGNDALIRSNTGGDGQCVITYTADAPPAALPPTDDAIFFD